MKNMSDDFLLNAYKQAIDLNLSLHFISLLKLEIHRRSIAEQLNQKTTLV